ncbi:MAG: glycosyltransferase family 2 protein [Candidatus Omnitrophica bacterium]|nr:glycosyltransferase family 2 protein [Candidatus Omnitrophota bacterium]MDD5500408.1 glycosyltransferase family 2 protein [Candidatus Omnitrophota bacterium]
MVSVVIPFFNERGNLIPLLKKLKSVLERGKYDYEIIFVDDGSTDKGSDSLGGEDDRRVKVIRLKNRYGQTLAIAAAFSRAQGDEFVTLDADLQNDPSDLCRMLDKLREGYDLVNGWRVSRKDSFLTKTFPSLVVNTVISRIFGVKIHDVGCAFKAYKREITDRLVFCGNMHRYVPLFASFAGFKVTEIKINHFPRIHGRSKYGLNRIPIVIYELAKISFYRFLLKKNVFCLGKIVSPEDIIKG